MNFLNLYINLKFWRKVRKNPLFAQGYFDTHQECWVVVQSKRELNRKYKWVGPFKYINPLTGQKVRMFARRDLVNENMKFFLQMEINI